MAHPAVLGKLVRQYETLSVLQAEHAHPEGQQRLDDVDCALCVSTNTTDVDAALLAARFGLPGSGLEDDSLLSA